MVSPSNTPTLVKQESSNSGWDEEGWDEEYDPEADVDANADDIDVPSTQIQVGKGYETLNMEKVKVMCLKKMVDLNDLFAMDEDPLLLIARYYQWNGAKMNNWFTQMESL
jgi:hypothetical protein